MKISVLFVCLGNICRSPVAEGTFSHLVSEQKIQKQFHIDSCGTAGYHEGELPHSLARGVAKSHGIILPSRARQFKQLDFTQFDYILPMDHENYAKLSKWNVSKEEKKRLHLFRSFDPICKNSTPIPDVPDPYYVGNISAFKEVQEIALRTTKEFLKWLLQKHNIK